MSYADAAARGPSQTAEEAFSKLHIANRAPGVSSETTSGASCTLRPCRHAANAPANPAASRAPQPPQILQQDLETRTTVDVDSPHVVSVSSTYSGETDTQMDRLRREAEQAEAEAKRRAAKASSEAKAKAKQAREKARHAGYSVRENSDNPVVVGNFVVWTAIAATLGFGAYRQNQAGTLSWKVAGTWAGAVGLFAAGDYFISSYLFKNRYPRK